MVAGVPFRHFRRQQPEQCFVRCASGAAALPKHFVIHGEHTRDERLEETEGHADPCLRLRVLDLAVEIVTGEDAYTNFLCVAVEVILDNNETLGHLAQGTQLQRVSLERDSDGEATVVAARMEFEVVYRTRPLCLSLLEEGGRRGGIPAYPADADAGASGILGLTLSLAVLEDEENTIAAHSFQILEHFNFENTHNS
jgi:hypothetical protein